MNAYEVLKIPPTASREEIRAAYRTLARRWHPDRFMEGPERDWANERMAVINAAYRLCMDGSRERHAPSESDTRNLEQAQRLIDDGQYFTARETLMGSTTRCAEWNYLFGTVLLHTSSLNKALIYLSIASHQSPQNAKYARALREAEALKTPERVLSRLFTRGR